MATNQTTNYNLSQWQPNDPVLRADFNADNQKVDAALAAKGNCRIVTGTYAGTGKYGSSNPNKLTFDGKPLIFFVASDLWAAYGATSFYRGTSTDQIISLSWGDTWVQWYNNTDVSRQLNSTGKTYRYIALLAP